MRTLLILLVCMFLVGCENPSDEITYSRSDSNMQLKITHRSGGASCTVTMKNATEAAQYKTRLLRLVREIEDFEKDLSIKEKTN